MCGIAGILGRPGRDAERGATVRRMTSTLRHRGPDGEGHASLDGCDLGFRRLAILDLEAPSPPFSNEDGTVWSVCNGEIYNAGALRDDLASRGHRFRTAVDTEVIPHLYEEQGDALVDRLDGMFAFAVYEVPRRRLLLGRDRAGEKPLFYRHENREIIFASELRAILAAGRGSAEVDPVALRRYLLHDYFPAPLTPFRSIRKLPAGHVMTVEAGRTAVRRYWCLSDHFGEGRRPPGKSIASIAADVDERIGAAVRSRRRSDVPVGVFLSGGLDSSVILSHLSEQNGAGVPVFTIGHTERSFDESASARRTARMFGADYCELVLSQADLEEGLALVGEGMDEPLGDASTIPMFLLARHARRRVGVILSGEGSDELFAGYPTYPGSRLAEWYASVPAPVRRVIARRTASLAPVSMGNVGLDYLLARFLSAAELDGIERHHSWFGSFPPGRHPDVLSAGVWERLAGDDPFAAARAVVAGRRFPDALSRLLHTDFTMFLQDDLLTKVDRTTMLVSLEARAPYLDPRLTEYVAGLPSNLKLRRSVTKAILRRAARHRLPAEILRRRKRGFNIPFSRWLLQGLGTRLRHRFDPERVRARGLLSPEGVNRLLDEHLDRKADHRKPIYTLLALDLWCDRTFGVGARVPVASRGAPSSDLVEEMTCR